MPSLQGTSASFQTKNAHNWDIFVKPNLSTFPTGQDNFVPIQLQRSVLHQVQILPEPSQYFPPKC